MSKKKAVGYDLSYIHYKSRPEYVRLDFLDKRGRAMMSSVEVLINLAYVSEEDVAGYVRAR